MQRFRILILLLTLLSSEGKLIPGSYSTNSRQEDRRQKETPGWKLILPQALQLAERSPANKKHGGNSVVQNHPWTCQERQRLHRWKHLDALHSGSLSRMIDSWGVSGAYGRFSALDIQHSLSLLGHERVTSEKSWALRLQRQSSPATSQACSFLVSYIHEFWINLCVKFIHELWV